MSTGDGTLPTPATEVHGQVSDVTGGQVAVGDRVFQIDAAQGSYVVINAEADVEVVRRPPPVLRPPPAFPGLVGRAPELLRIRAALESGLSVEVHGPGGIGKTALLRAVSNAPLPESTPDGVVAIPARLGTADTLGYLFDTCYVGTRRVVPRREELTSALADLRLLVVLDDTSLARDDIDALREALPASLLLLAGIQQRVYDGVEGIALRGLAVDDAIQLIRAAVGRELSEHERAVGAKVSEVLHGTPLELVRFASLARAGDGDLVSVARGFGVDAQPEDLLVAVRRSVTVEEEGVLAALAAFAAPVGAGPVAAFSGSADAGALLLELCRRGLVQGDDLQGWRAREDRAAPPEDRQRAAVVLADWVRHRSVPEEVAGEIPAIASGLRQARQDRRWVDAIALAAAAERPLALAGRWSAWRDTLDAGRSAADAAGDAVSATFFSHQLAVVDDAMTEVMPVVHAATSPRGGPPSGPPSTFRTEAASEPAPVEPLREEGHPRHRRRVVAIAAALVVLFGVGVGAVVRFTSEDGSSGETTATPTEASTGPTTDGTTAPPSQDAPNLQAYTLASEPAEVEVNGESAFTVRVYNKPLDSREVGASTEGFLTVSITGDDAELVRGVPGCQDSSGSLRCELQSLGAGDKADLTVTVRGVSEGSVVVRTVAQATGFEPGPTAERPFTVTGGNGTDCEVPDVGGMSADAATAEVEANGLTAARQDVESGAAPPGTVVGQSPDPGSMVSCGTQVTLQVSKGLM